MVRAVALEILLGAVLPDSTFTKRIVYRGRSEE